MYTTKTVGSQTTSPWIPLDDNQAAFNVSVAVAVTGTLTYTVQFTLDNIQDPSVTPVAFEVSSLTGKTADASTSLRSSVKAVRLNVTSYTSGSATIGVRQGTSWDGVDFATSSGPVTLLQANTPFWIPPGDGGSNGLIFTGTRGVFSLSAESPLANAWIYLAGGCYIYLPTGSGGLVSGGWRWCVMTGTTAGEVYAETYSGVGTPPRVSSPTALPNLTATRITQVTTEVNAIAFTLPGNSIGPNGLYVSKLRNICTNSAGAKTTRLRISNASPDNRIWALGYTNQYNVVGAQFTGFAYGSNRIIKCSGNSAANQTWDNPGNQPTATTSDVLTVDLTVDQTLTLSMQVTANTDSIILVPGQFTVQYGG